MRNVLSILSLAIALGGCVPSYRPDLQQGNIVTPEMVQALKIGMPKSQVRYTLGTPLITDPFHKDRWDYVYAIRKGRGEIKQQRLTVFFKNDLVTAIEGDLAANTPN